MVGLEPPRRAVVQSRRRWRCPGFFRVVCWPTSLPDVGGLQRSRRISLLHTKQNSVRNRGGVELLRRGR